MDGRGGGGEMKQQQKKDFISGVGKYCLDQGNEMNNAERSEIK